MTKHTPGPWTPRSDGAYHGDPREPDPEMMHWTSGVDCIAPFTENEAGDYERITDQPVASARGRTLDEAQANARLIATAPDLLSALRALLQTACNLTDESRTWHYDATGRKIANYRDTCPMCIARAAIAKAEGRA